MIRNIVLDLGGVLFRLDREEALRRFSALGVPDVEKMLDPYLQSGYFLQVEDGRMTEPEFRAALSSLAGRTLTYDDIAHAYFGFLAEVDAYKFDFIEEELGDYRIFILSNTNPYVMDFCESDRFPPQRPHALVLLRERSLPPARWGWSSPTAVSSRRCCARGICAPRRRSSSTTAQQT